MSRIINLLIFSPLFFLFLPSMYVPGLQIPVYDISIGISLITLMLSNRGKTIINNILQYREYNFVKILLIYILWVFTSGFIQIIRGEYNFSYSLYAMFILFFYNDILWFLYPSFIFPKLLKEKTLIKILLVAIYLICIYGLIITIFDLLNIPILKYIHQIIVNRRILAGADITRVLYTGRCLSVFEEPGYFGGFLCINLPLIFRMVISKYKILKNKFLDFYFKKSFIPIVAITIIAIQSPIWLVFSIIVTIIYFKESIFIKHKRKTIILTVIISCFFLIQFSNIDIENTFLFRIQKTISSISDFKSFVKNEPSLANRILSYIVRVKVFKKYPITGAGYKNTEYHAAEVFSNLTYDLTYESKIKLQKAISGKMAMNGAIFWDTLSDTGLIGIILYYLFILLLIKKNIEISKLLPKGIVKDFIISVKNTYICIICFSFYDIRPNFIYFWFLYGLTLSFAAYYKQVPKFKIQKEVL